MAWCYAPVCVSPTCKRRPCRHRKGHEPKQTAQPLGSPSWPQQVKGDGPQQTDHTAITEPHHQHDGHQHTKVGGEGDARRGDAQDDQGDLLHTHSADLSREKALICLWRDIRDSARGLKTRSVSLSSALSIFTLSPSLYKKYVNVDLLSVSLLNLNTFTYTYDIYIYRPVSIQTLIHKNQQRFFFMTNPSIISLCE